MVLMIATLLVNLFLISSSVEISLTHFDMPTLELKQAARLNGQAYI
jgi:hypothetical protein